MTTSPAGVHDTGASRTPSMHHSAARATSSAGNQDKGFLNLPSVSANFEHPQARSSSARSISATVGNSEVKTTKAQDAAGKTSATNPCGADCTAVDRNSVNPCVADNARISYASATVKRPVKRQDLAAHVFHDLRPTKEGDQFSLKIPKALYLKEVQAFEHALTGRLLLGKGDKPRSTMELKSELQQIWAINSDWQLIPLGKGFYTLRFTTATDKTTAKAKVIWELSKGLLRLREWTRNFDPFKENSPLANVWVRIHYLPIEYWNPQIISGIGRYLGHPLKIDGASAGRDFGHFARILVEIDMSHPLPNTLLIDMEDFSFHIEFVFENLPLYCGRCKITGHSPDRCRKSKFGGMGEQNDTVNDKAKLTQVHNGPHCHAAITSNEQDANPAQAAPLKKQQQVENAKPAAAWSKVAEQAVKKQIVVPVLQKEDVETRNAFQALDLENNAENCLDTAVDPISGPSFGVHLSQPDSLDKILVPIQGDTNVIKDSDLVINEEDSDVEETLEMEAPDGTGLNTPIIDDTAVALERDPTLDKSGGSHEGNKDLSAGPDNISSRISRLEEQVSQGMQLLSDKTTKRGRGRPKGTGKGMGSEPIQAVPEGSIKGRLRNAGEMGYKPSNFVVDYSNSDSMNAMNNIVHRRWSDEMDDYPDLWDH